MNEAHPQDRRLEVRWFWQAKDDEVLVWSDRIPEAKSNDKWTGKAVAGLIHGDAECCLLDCRWRRKFIMNKMNNTHKLNRESQDCQFIYISRTF
jgi:hypothetical protein